MTAAVPGPPGPPTTPASGYLRVGHKGAAALAEGNTAASFAVAVAHGVDMLEFDVVAMRDGRLVLAHDVQDAEGRTPLTLEEGLDLLAGAPYRDIALDVDLKRPGYEGKVLAALEERGLAGRSLVSSTYLESLDAVARLRGPNGPRRGWSVPRARRDYTKTRLAPLALAALVAIRAWLPRRAAQLVAAGRCEAVMAHERLVGPALADAVRAAGGELYAWTVDDAARIAEMARLGVHGIISNDPRLFP